MTTTYRFSQTGEGASAPKPMNQYQTPFNVSVSAVVEGTATYTIEHTFDHPFQDAGNMAFFSHPDLEGETGNADGNYAFPVSAIRVNVTSGAGTVHVTLLQGAY